MKRLVWILAKIFLLILRADDIIADNDPGQCCEVLKLTMSGSALEQQDLRQGMYRMRSPSEYHQRGGQNILYKWGNEAWYFGLDSHTSGVQSEKTAECPNKVEQWRFWTLKGDMETWSEFQKNMISVTCVDDTEDQDGSLLSEDRVLVDEMSSTNGFLYTKSDGPNIDCSKLDQTDAGYPPQPRVVLLGESGVGKSTLANQLLGCYKKDKDCLSFSVGRGSRSHTTSTSWAVGNYLGKGGCITIVDTPGASDSEGRDYEHALEMAEVMQNDLGSVNIFLLTFNGEVPRFLAPITKLLKLYVSIFSEDLWKHSITEFSYWSWDDYSVDKRLEQLDINATVKHGEWNMNYREKLGVSRQIPTIFIDPVFPIFSTKEKNQKKVRREPEALEKFKFYTNLFWNLASAMPPFDCKERCSAPTGYFAGTPWVTTPIVKGRLGSSQFANCQIWNGIIDAASSSNMRWVFNSTTVIFQKMTETSSYTIKDLEWSDKIDVRENKNEHYTEFQLTLKNLNSETQGVYTCENDKDSANNKVEMLLIIDGTWTTWGAWGQCSTSCMVEGGSAGTKQRSRTCNLPQNGGKECIASEAEEQEICAGENKSFTFCQINHDMSQWTKWATCSVACGDGTTLRSRRCTEGRHGGTRCPQTPNFESKSCNIKQCPACKQHQWSSWSKCSEPCLKISAGSETYGNKTRKRTFEEIDPDKPVCEPDHNKETVQCAGDKEVGVTYCRVDAKWTWWSEYGHCSVTCGTGTQTSVRTCTDQSFGGTPCDQLDGDRREHSSCDGTYGPCPQDCEVSQWTVWGECSTNCGPGFKKKTREITKYKKFSGKGCGQLEQTDNCFEKACPPCGDYWKPWTEWTLCTNGEKTQTRSKSLDLNTQTSEFTGMDCSHVEDRIENSDCPDSYLKWISASTAKSLRNPENYANFVMPKNRYKYPKNWYQMFCRAEIDGCNYPGSLLVRTDGTWVCSIITQGKIYFDYGRNRNYEVLYNPNGSAKIAWLPWASGSDSTSFPEHSVKSDASCGLTLGRYNDYNEAAMVTSDGLVYYNDGGSYDKDWEWDNNDYDILIEKGV